MNIKQFHDLASITQLTAVLFIGFTLTGCGGSKTFNDYARAGDTVAVAGGWQQNFNRENISVTIKEKGPGGAITASYPQGDPAIRASVNFYADPLSSMIVSRETGIEQTEYANIYAQTIDTNYTNGDKDWYQTTVFVDLPTNVISGVTYRVIVNNTQAESFESDVKIIDGVGSPSTFSAPGQDLQPVHLEAISRVPHFTVSFQATTIPDAIELTLTHDPDSTAGGTGKALAVNPTGFKKNLTWSDNGTQMKVILTTSSDVTPDNIKDYKFYVAGGIDNLAVYSVSAFDSNGNPVPGVSASATSAN